MKEYYTYAYLREDGTPYYVGKGKNNRCYKPYGRKNCKTPKDKKRILKLKQNLSEDEAFKHEIYMIAILGKKSEGGLLHNITDGGEGTSGMKHNAKSKEKIGKAFRGKKLTPEHVEKVKKAQKGRVSPLRGRTLPQETKDLIKKTLTGVKHTEERKKNISKAHKGKKWYNNGKINKFCYDCPVGFTAGMIKKK